MALDLEQFRGGLITLAPDRIKDEAKRELIVRYQRAAGRLDCGWGRGRHPLARHPLRATA